MTLSELLDVLRSSPSLEALRQIPQPILIEWVLDRARRWREPPSPGSKITHVHIFDIGASTSAIQCILYLHAGGHFFIRLDLADGMPYIEAHARQQQIQQQAPLAAWQAESEARLIEDVG